MIPCANPDNEILDPEEGTACAIRIGRGAHQCHMRASCSQSTEDRNLGGRYADEDCQCRSTRLCKEGSVRGKKHCVKRLVPDLHTPVPRAFLDHVRSTGGRSLLGSDGMGHDGASWGTFALGHGRRSRNVQDFAPRSRTGSASVQ